MILMELRALLHVVGGRNKIYTPLTYYNTIHLHASDQCRT